MISIKSNEEIHLMQIAADIARECMQLLSDNIQVGVETKYLDKLAFDFIKSKGGSPSFKGYQGFPASICASINEEVVHGIPSERKLKDGDIIGIDLGVYINGYHSDMARTFAVGDVSDDAMDLMNCAKLCFDEALKVMYPNNRLGDIGNAVQTTAEARGYSVIRSLCGHGIGKDLHESPEVLNFGSKGRGLRLKEGMVLAVEPMINIGGHEIVQLSDGWTIITKDKSLSAHYENTVYISGEGPVVLTDR
ncbi:MAG: type I methionyl aminopeptidase [Eubacteriales bacterium]